MYRDSPCQKRRSASPARNVLRTKLADIQSFKYTNICTLHKLKVIHKLHAVGTALCMAFILCYLHMLVLLMMVDVKQLINNIKSGIYSFWARHNLIGGFLRHCAP